MEGGGGRKHRTDPDLPGAPRISKHRAAAIIFNVSSQGLTLFFCCEQLRAPRGPVGWPGVHKFHAAGHPAVGFTDLFISADFSRPIMELWVISADFNVPSWNFGRFLLFWAIARPHTGRASCAATAY